MSDLGRCQWCGNPIQASASHVERRQGLLHTMCNDEFEAARAVAARRMTFGGAIPNPDPGAPRSVSELRAIAGMWLEQAIASADAALAHNPEHRNAPGAEHAHVAAASAAVSRAAIELATYDGGTLTPVYESGSRAVLCEQCGAPIADHATHHPDGTITFSCPEQGHLMIGVASPDEWELRLATMRAGLRSLVNAEPVHEPIAETFERWAQHVSDLLEFDEGCGPLPRMVTDPRDDDTSDDLPGGVA